ncbi:MAG: sulfotransferase, partial [Saprospiraceae bacterium]
GNLRFISGRRVMAVLVFYPVFALFFLVNWFFLLLDELLFPDYRKTDCSKSVFIIGIPRSATTLLYKILAADTRHFHCFKLWELVFAPSILQKYFFVGVQSLDRRIGNPLYRLSLWLDKVIFGEFRGIHEMGLSKPEEDEVLFLYNFSSVYLHFFYPDTPVLDNVLRYDEMLPEKVRTANVNFYYRCIQRHQYVFDRRGKRFFLSKNPCFVSKMNSIALRFDRAKFIYPLRSPLQAIPSTISLNARIHAVFTSAGKTFPLAEKTTDRLLDWYLHADHVMKTTIGERGYTAYYQRLTTEPKRVFKEIYRFLGIDHPAMQDVYASIDQNTRYYASPHRYLDRLTVDTDLVYKRLNPVFSPEIWNKI